MRRSIRKASAAAWLRQAMRHHRPHLGARGYSLLAAAVLAVALPAATATSADAATATRNPAVFAGLHLVPARADISASGPFSLPNGAHGLCLDAVRSGDGSNGDNVQLWACNGGANQQWFLNGNATITNAAHGLCLDAVRSGDGSNGDNVQLWACNGGTNQQWFAGPFGLDLANGAHGLCLDAVRSGDGSDGDNVQLWACNGGTNQQW